MTSEPLSDEQLAEIRARVQAAQPIQPDFIATDVEQVNANLRFIYAARDDLLAVLAELDRVRAKLDAIRRLAHE